MAYKNKEKSKEYFKSWYLRNKDSQYKKIKDRQARINKIIQEIRINGKCSKCTENHPACLDFHHIDKSDKSINISKIGARGWSLEKMMLEINKCILLCSNCHRKLHYNENS